MPAVWVLGPAETPCGARVLGDSHTGQPWVDVCVLGQHLPQMYRPAEIHDLDQAGCDRLGLCPGCLGFGDLDPALARDMGEAARGIDQLADPCRQCGGSGRPALRAGVIRDANVTTGTMEIIQHLYVPPLDGSDPVLRAAFGVPADACLACGMPTDGTWTHGEPVHVDG